jgi:pyrimidine and pyridine-specific 5'-nucleotidase
VCFVIDFPRFLFINRIHKKKTSCKTNHLQTPQETMTEPKPKRIIFIDLDDTLYPKSSGINICVYNRISAYLQERLGIENAPEKAYELYLKHGTTLRGLIEEGYKLESVESFYAFAHTGFSYEGRITKNDTKLIRLLERIKENKSSAEIKLFLFTNSDMGHATRITEWLGIKHLFDGFICFEDLGLNCKPHKVSYEIAMMKAGISTEEPKNGLNNNRLLEVFFFDDNIQNVRMAIEMGWTKVVWLNENKLPNTENIPECQSIYDLEVICPELFV